MAKKSKYKVDTNIPLPKAQKHWSKFPFAYMGVGNSFLVSTEDEEMTSCNQLKQYLYNKAKKYCVETFSMSKYSFHVDRVKKTVRVFRIE